MNHTIDPAISALTYRIASLERKNEELEALCRQAAVTAAVIRKELEAHKARPLDAEPVGPDPDKIVVPPELRISRSRVKRGQRRTGGGNRKMEVAAKRWALWKLQRQQGYTVLQIARAWDCNHTSICHAQSRGFKPYAGCGK